MKFTLPAPRWASRLAAQLTGPGELPDKWVALFHLGFAVFLFSPFFLLGHKMVASYDNFQHLFPNFIWTARHVRAGDLGFWNDALFGGMDFTGSVHNYVYSPLNWPFFFIPEAWLGTAFTLRMFVETFLLGWFGYLFFREEIRSTRWALMSSTILQMGGGTLFALTTYMHLSILAFGVMGLYWLWSLERRALWKTFLGVTLSFVIILTTQNLVYALALCFWMAVLVTYRALTVSPERSVRLTTLVLSGLSGVCALALSAPRLIPVLGSVGGERMSGLDNYNGNAIERTLYGLKFFIPEVFGIRHSESFVIFGKISHLTGEHAQFHGFPFLGTIPALLAVTAFLHVRRGRPIFWLLLSALCGGAFLGMRPFADFVNFITFPLLHSIVCKIAIPLFFAGLVGHWGASLGKANPLIGDIRWKIAVIAIPLLALITWTYFDAPKMVPPFKGAVLIGIFSCILLFAVRPPARWIFDSIGKFIPLLGAGICFGIGILYWDLQFPIHAAAAFGGAALVILAAWTTWSDLRSPTTPVVLIAAIAGVALFIPQSGALNFPYRLSLSLVCLILGLVKFAFLATATARIQSDSSQQKMNLATFWFLAWSLTVADLILFNKTHSAQLLAPFQNDIQGFQVIPPHPLLRVQDLNMSPYRIHNPALALGLAEDTHSSTNVHLAVPNVRAFSGVNSIAPPRARPLIEAFGLPVSSFSVGAIAANLPNDRLLDLIGCQYAAPGSDAPGGIRPSIAVPRFGVYEGFRVATRDEEALNILKDPKFAPSREVVVPKAPSGFSSRPKTVVPISYAASTTSHIQLEASGPGILLFNDSYHPDWSALVDGQPTEIRLANYLFMSVELPPGHHKVEFQFRPKKFFQGVRIAKAGLIALVALACAWALFGRSQVGQAIARVRKPA